MGQAIIRFGELKVEQFTQGIHNNYVVFSPLPFSKAHSSGIDDNVVITATPNIEIVDADLDVEIDDQYSFAYSISTDNRMKVAYDKEKYASQADFLDKVKNINIVYELGQLTTIGNNYILITRNSLGEEIQRSKPMSPDQILNTILTFDTTRSVAYGGFLKHEIMLDYIVV